MDTYDLRIGDIVHIKIEVRGKIGLRGAIIDFLPGLSKPYVVKIEGLNNPRSLTGLFHFKKDEIVPDHTWYAQRYYSFNDIETTVENKFIISSIDPYAWELTIANVKFNPPATIVFWTDGTKTVVKSNGTDIYDPEKGLAMAIVKKALGNKGNYYNVFKKWIHENANFTDPLKSEIADDIYDNG